MSDHGGPNVSEMLTPGPAGDTVIDVKFTARELASLEYLLALAERAGLIDKARLGSARAGLDPHWAIAFGSAQCRIGMAFADCFSPGHALDFAAALAQFDQEAASLNEGNPT